MRPSRSGRVFAASTSFAMLATLLASPAVASAAPYGTVCDGASLAAALPTAPALAGSEVDLEVTLSCENAAQLSLESGFVTVSSGALTGHEVQQQLTLSAPAAWPSVSTSRTVTLHFTLPDATESSALPQGRADIVNVVLNLGRDDDAGLDGAFVSSEMSPFSAAPTRRSLNVVSGPPAPAGAPVFTAFPAPVARLTTQVLLLGKPLSSSVYAGWFKVSDDGSLTYLPSLGTYTGIPADLAGARLVYAETGSKASDGAPLFTSHTPVYTVAATPAPSLQGAGYGYTLPASAVQQLPANTAFQSKLVPGTRLEIMKPLQWASEFSSVQWFRNGRAIPGATKPLYLVTREDGNATLQAKWSTRQAGFASTTVAAAPLAVPKVPVASALPTHATRGVKVGQKLTVSTPSWSKGTTFSYQWRRQGKAIAGATAASYVVTAADYRAGTVSVRVTGRHPQYTPVTRESQETQLIARGTLRAGSVSLAAVPRAGVSAKVKRSGTWSTGTTYRYQWKVNGKAIRGATKATYKPTKAQRGAKLSVVVSASRDGYVSISRSAPAQRIR